MIHALEASVGWKAHIQALMRRCPLQRNKEEAEGDKVSQGPGLLPQNILQSIILQCMEHAHVEDREALV